MDEPLRLSIGVVLLVCGWALAIYAGYRQYVALPGEHAARHVITRATLAAVGVVLVLLAIWFLR